MVDITAPTGLMGWVQQNGQFVLFFAQLAYWIVICVAAVWATLIFRRLVALKEARHGLAASPDAAPPNPTEIGPTISVDEFVD